MKRTLAQQDHTGHPTGLAIPAVRKEALRVTIGTQATAVDIRDSNRSQANSGQGIQVGEIMVGTVWIANKTSGQQALLSGLRGVQKSRPHLSPHFKRPGPMAGPSQASN